MAATLVIRNGRVRTMDPALPWAEAIALDGATIGFVGADEEVSARIGPETEVIDSAGCTVLPGFIDAHNHVRGTSSDVEVDLSGAGSLDEVKALVRRSVDEQAVLTARVPPRPAATAASGNR